jgi:Domain of unknown function (DUF4159)
VITRRKFLKLFLTGSVLSINLPVSTTYRASEFYFTQLTYNGEWDPRPRAYRRLMSTLDLRTSVKASFEKKEIEIESPDLFNFPFLYLAGESSFEPFSEFEIKRLRKFLTLGGTLLIDDASGEENSPFDNQIRLETDRIFPEYSLERIPRDHVLYKSFYLLSMPSGRRIIKPYLEGITFEDEERTALIYSRNDLGGAWSEDEFGRWQYECIPGGESQRELAFRTGINIIIYALTDNYKKDQIHAPFIIRRQMNL